MSELVDTIQQIVKGLIEVQSFNAKVTAVDLDEYSCTVEPVDGSAESLAVKLRGVINDQDTGMIIVPAVGSDVVVSIIQNDPAQSFIAQFSTWESILIHKKSNNQTVFKLEIKADGKVTLDADELLFNGGSKGGLIEIAKLSAEIAKNSAFLTALKAGVNAHIPVPQDGGAALKASILAATGSSQVANLSQVTNDKFKH